MKTQINIETLKTKHTKKKKKIVEPYRIERLMRLKIKIFVTR